MDMLHTQKENLENDVATNSSVAGKQRLADANKYSASKRGFKIHDDSNVTEQKITSTSDDSNVTDKKITPRKASKNRRRVLSDISNKQRIRHGSKNVADIGRSKIGLSEHKIKRSASKLVHQTPLRKKAENSPTLISQPSRSLKKQLNSLKNATMPPCPIKIPDIELAYGGLTSPRAKSTYIKGLSNDIWQDLMNDYTRTLTDDFDPTRIVDDWNDSLEKAMVESEEPHPLPWVSPDLQQKKTLWDSELKNVELEEEIVIDDLNYLPPPENLPRDAVAHDDHDILLEDLLSVNVETLCSE